MQLLKEGRDLVESGLCSPNFDAPPPLQLQVEVQALLQIPQLCLPPGCLHPRQGLVGCLGMA